MLMTVSGLGRLRTHGRGMREYKVGSYPVPGWGYATPAAPAAAPAGCCGMSKSRAARIVKSRLRGLGYYSNPFGDGGAVPVVDYNPALWVSSGAAPAPVPPDYTVYPATPGGGTITSSELARISALTGAAIGNVPPPGVSPSTLLAAAGLPGAPSIVKQAAANYSAANPVNSLLSGTILGLPSYLVLGGGLLAVVLLMGKGRR